MNSTDKSVLVARAKEATKVKSWPAYEKQFSQYEGHCKEMKFEIYSPDSLLAYVQSSLEKGYSPNTVNTWITGIVKISEEKGLTWSKEKLKPIYERINVQKANYKTKKAESFSRENIEEIWEKLSENTTANVYKKLLFSIWTSGFMRVCQLDALTWDDVQRTDTKLTITKQEVKRKIKSANVSPETSQFVLTAQTDVTRCPVFLYDEYVKNLEKFKIPREGKFWKQLIEHHDGKSILKNQNMGIHKLGTFAKALANEIGLDNVDDFSSHSFRHTAATVGAESGLSEDQLKVGGGWQSLNVAKGYIQNSKMNSETITSKVLFGTTDGNVNKKEFVAQRNLKNSIEFVESSTMGIRNGTSNNGSFIFNVFGGNLRVGDMTVDSPARKRMKPSDSDDSTD